MTKSNLWTFHFTMLNNISIFDNFHFRVMANGTLLIEKSSANDEGHYLCKADNGVAHGSTLSKLAEIKVNGNNSLFKLIKLFTVKTKYIAKESYIT